MAHAHPLKDIPASKDPNTDGTLPGTPKAANYQYIPPHMARLHNSLYDSQRPRASTGAGESNMVGEKSFPFRQDVKKSYDEQRLDSLRSVHYKPKYRRGYLVG